MFRPCLFFPINTCSQRRSWGRGGVKFHPLAPSMIGVISDQNYEVLYRFTAKILMKINILQTSDKS